MLCNTDGSGALAITAIHHSIASSDKELPIRPRMVVRAQFSTPFCSIRCSRSGSEFPSAALGEGSIPANVIEAMFGDRRCASSNATCAPTLVATR